MLMTCKQSIKRAREDRTIDTSSSGTEGPNVDSTMLTSRRDTKSDISIRAFAAVVMAEEGVGFYHNGAHPVRAMATSAIVRQWRYIGGDGLQR